MNRSVPVAGLILTAALAGCATTAPTAAESTSASSTEITSTPAPTTEVTVVFLPPAETSESESSSGEPLIVSAIRTTGGETSDRVEIEFSEGALTPGWRVTYVDEPLGIASGIPIQMAGASFLSVAVIGTTYPDGVPSGSVSTDTGQIAEVSFDGTFEDRSLVLIGLAGEQRPYRVFPLTDPTRIVIEIEH